MRPARVFLVVWWFDRLGGMERHVTDLAIALARRGIAVTVFSEKPVARSNQYARALRAAQIVIVAPPRLTDLVARIEHRRSYRFLSGRNRAIAAGDGRIVDQHLSQALLLRAMARHAAIAPPEIVHLHGCRLGQQAVLQWTAARGYPAVYTEHTTISDWGGPFDAGAPEVVGNLADVVACVSERSRASLLTYLPNPRDIHVVRHIVAAPDPAPGTPEQSSQRPVRFLAVGRLAAHKGYATLLTAAAVLQAEGCDFDLWIAGDGPQLAELTALRRALALDDRVTFLGRVEQAAIAALWRAADIAVMPSHSEGMPLSIMEAMAQAKPIVASRVGGIPEVIHDGQNGLLVEAGDAAGLADALRRVIADPALARLLADGARRIYETGGWSEAAVSDHHLTLYDTAAKTQAMRAAIAAEARRGWIETRMREVAAPIGRVALLTWRLARHGTMEAMICRQALILAQAGVDVILLSERPIGPLNGYVRQMRRAGVRVVAPSFSAAIMHLMLARVILAFRPGATIISPLQRTFVTQDVARRPDVVHIHGWGLGNGWASLDFVMKQARERQIVSIYTEHADVRPGAIAVPAVRSAGALSASSPAAARALAGATGRIVTRFRHDGQERSPATPGRDAVVLMGRDQGFAVALADALADFAPVVICGPIDDLLVRDGVDCLIAGDDPAGALVLLASEPTFALELTAQGRRTYETSGLRDFANLAETIALYRGAGCGATAGRCDANG